MTAHAMQGDKEKCLEAGMDDYHSKPVTPASLTVMLEKWLLATPRPALTPQPQEKAAKPPPQPASSSPVVPLMVFNYEQLLECMMQDTELVQTLIAGFMEDMPVRFKALHKALAEGDLAHAHLQAHTIKGAAASLCCQLMADAAHIVEKAFENSDTAAAEAAISDLAAAFEATQLHLNGYISTRFSRFFEKHCQYAAPTGKKLPSSPMGAACW